LWQDYFAWFPSWRRKQTELKYWANRITGFCDSWQHTVPGRTSGKRIVARSPIRVHSRKCGGDFPAVELEGNVYCARTAVDGKIPYFRQNKFFQLSGKNVERTNRQILRSDAFFFSLPPTQSFLGADGCLGTATKFGGTRLSSILTEVGLRNVSFFLSSISVNAIIRLQEAPEHIAPR